MRHCTVTELPDGSLFAVKGDDRLPTWHVVYLGGDIFFTPLGVKRGPGWVLIMNRHFANCEVEVL